MGIGNSFSAHTQNNCNFKPTGSQQIHKMETNGQQQQHQQQQQNIENNNIKSNNKTTTTTTVRAQRFQCMTIVERKPEPYQDGEQLYSSLRIPTDKSTSINLYS